MYKIVLFASATLARENKDKNQWFVRKCAVLMAAWLYVTYLVISLVPYFGSRF